jgi:hypothetical protein
VRASYFSRSQRHALRTLQKANSRAWRPHRSGIRSRRFAALKNPAPLPHFESRVGNTNSSSARCSKKRLEVPNRPEPRTTAHVSFGCLAKPQLSEGRRSELRIITATATPKQLPQKKRILLSADRTKTEGPQKITSPAHANANDHWLSAPVQQCFSPVLTESGSVNRENASAQTCEVRAMGAIRSS